MALALQPGRTPRFLDRYPKGQLSSRLAHHMVMAPHVLACALFCNPDGGVNGLGWGFLAALGVAALAGIVSAVAKSGTRRRKR